MLTPAPWSLSQGRRGEERKIGMKFWFSKYLFLVPVIVVFVMPWIHHLAVINFMSAMPGWSRDQADVWTFCLSLAGVIIPAFAVGMINS